MANRVKAHLLNAQTFPARIKTAQLRDREMGKLLLPNGIKVVLISDKTTPTAGAAMSIEAGSWLDGKHQGTAHFLEHMLFLGTKKYPDESDYERYMFDSNGTLNGYTANDHSMYYFSSILPSALPGALDRFSRFFYEPMLAKSCINREMNAVDEEYRKNLESDAWRFLHVQKDLANAHHPFSGFNTGNLDTMRLIDHSYLSSWFVRNYVADKMNLVVHGKESIEELTDQVYKHFSPIKRSQNVGDFNDLGDVFPKSMKKKVVWVDPIKNVKQLSLHWEIPERFMSLKTKPANIVSSIIGNEGHNSLLSELKKKGYVETLSAGASELGYSNNMFEISVSLTDNGLKCWQSVVEQIFAGLRSLEREQVSSYVVDEINAMSKTHYEYQQRSSSIATNYCQALRKEPLDSFPFHSYFIETFSRELIGDVFRHLSPENAFVMILAKNDAVKYESQEKWMGAAYCTKSWLPSSVILPDNVKLPAPNQFISKKLELLDIKTSQVPEMIHSSEGVTLYHFPDNSFESPEAAIHFFIKTPSISPGNAKSLALSMVWNKFVADRLTEYSYNSSIAGLNYRVHTSKSTLCLTQILGLLCLSMATIKAH